MHTLSTSNSPVKPAYRVLADADADRPDWLEARRGLITASEVPIVLGMYGYGRLVRYWYEKAGLIERESGDEFEGAQMGHYLEPINAELFAKKTARRLVREQKLLGSTRYPWLGATLDYTQHFEDRPGAPVELKTSGPKHNWPESEDDIKYPEIEFIGEPSLRYQAQLQTQMLVYGAEWGSISAVLGSPYMHHRWRDLALHPGFSQLILQRTEAFWHSIQRGQPPAPDDSEQAHDALKLRALRARPGTIRRLPDLAAEWDAELRAACATRLKAKKAIRYYESLLLTAIGDAEAGRLPNGDQYVVRRSARAGYTVKPTTVITLQRKAT